MTDEKQETPSKIIIENDANFFSPIVSKETTKVNSNKNGKKYRLDDIEIPSMQLASKSNIPPKLNHGIWTTEVTEERKLRKRYYIRLLILVVLMLLSLGLIIFSSFMLNTVTSRSGETTSNLSHHIAGQKTPKFRTSTPDTEDVDTKLRPSTKPSRNPIGNIPENTDFVTIKYPYQTIDQGKMEISNIDNTLEITNPAKEESTTNNFITVTEIITRTELIANPSTSSPTSRMRNTDVIDQIDSMASTKRIYATGEDQIITDIHKDAIDWKDSTTSTTKYATREVRVDATDESQITTDSRHETQYLQTGVTTDVVIETTFIDDHVTTSDVSELDQVTTPVPSDADVRGTTTESQHLTTLQSTKIRCEKVTIDACRNFVPMSSGVSTDLEAHYTFINQSVDLATCHVNALEVVCSMYAAPCDRELTLNLPCRSTCNQVARSCFIEDDELYQGWLDNCTRLAESSEKDVCFSVSSASSLEADNSCSDGYCLNGGSCFDFQGQPFCRCPIYFAGNRCSIPFTLGGNLTEPIDDETCVPIPNNECAELLSYNQTLEDLVGGTVAKPPWEIIAPMAACSDKSMLMFCAELYPESECSPLERPPYVICKTLCDVVQKQCLYFYAALKFPLFCDGGVYQEESAEFYCV